MSDGDARTTERLMLRPPGPGDAPAYRALLMHPTIGEWLRPPPEQPFEPGDGDAWPAEDTRHWERFGSFAMILPANAASLRVAAKIGMARAGNVDHAGFDHLLFRTVPRSTAPRRGGLDSGR